MKIIDLTAPIYHHMPVYPGDPELEIEQVDTYEKTKINMARLHINTHDGTHVNAPFHMDNDGKKIDGYGLESFCGPCLLDTITSDK